MDLTVAARAARNPDGVVFYKIWNGRELTEDAGVLEDASRRNKRWALVAYVQTLRAK